MEALAKVNYRHQPLIPSFHHQRPSLSRPISSLPFTSRPPLLQSSPFLKSSSSLPVKASLLPSPTSPFSKPQLFQILNPLAFSIVRTTLIATVTATALFFARFNLKPAIAALLSPPPTVTTTSNDAVSEEERERTLEEHLQSHPDDVEALRTLMEIKIKNRKPLEAISIIEQLMVLEPHDNEWPLLKSHLCVYSGELELAKAGFNELLEKDPLSVEAFHGLVMAAGPEDSNGELKNIEKRMEEAMKRCKKENKKSDLRGFKLLLAQIRVIEGEYEKALKIYQELVKEEPRDFRPYLCQGIVYTLLRKNEDAERNFEKYRRLVPKNHPYASYFDDNMIATKLFGQKVLNDEAKLKRKDE